MLAQLEQIRIDAEIAISLADLIVFAGGVAVEAAAELNGIEVNVPFTPGRVDADESATEPQQFAVLEPHSDGFRNYHRAGYALPAEHALIDRAQQLQLSAPEMTVLVGGLRSLGVSYGEQGLLTDRPGVLSSDFFTNLLRMDHEWTATEHDAAGTAITFVAKDRRTGADTWTGSRADLVFGSHAQLRAIAEVYAQDGQQEKMVKDFVTAWVKVMELDRFDLHR